MQCITLDLHTRPARAHVEEEDGWVVRWAGFLTSSVRLGRLRRVTAWDAAPAEANGTW